MGHTQKTWSKFLILLSINFKTSKILSFGFKKVEKHDENFLEMILKKYML